MLRLWEGRSPLSEAIPGVEDVDFEGLARAIYEPLFDARKVEWLDRLEADHDNLRAALATLLEYDPELCLRLASAATVRMFWSMRGHYTEGWRWLETALERGGGAPAVRPGADDGRGVTEQGHGAVPAPYRRPAIAGCAGTLDPCSRYAVVSPCEVRGHQAPHRGHFRSQKRWIPLGETEGTRSAQASGAERDAGA